MKSINDKVPQYIKSLFTLCPNGNNRFRLPLPQLDIYKSHSISFGAVMSWNSLHINLRSSMRSISLKNFKRKLGNYLLSMNISEHCIVVGDFNSHSPSWGYPEQDARGEEVEDWQTSSNLLLINDAEDPPTYYSRSWMKTSTPDLAFATEDIALKTCREVDNQLGGSDHRPVILTIDNLPQRREAPHFTRWNYKKAKWDLFRSLTNEMSQA